MKTTKKSNTSHTEHNLWKWIGSWFGYYERGSVTFECSDPNCDCQHTITIWHTPGEDTWEVIQQQVQKEFERQQK